ncbi:hypothetical protein L4C38_10885 [Vibrio kasasachensis]|uniref:hypothetical protein n=1 Tax=Vibrio kasasachensis TaxID=2910248 RepID=UPI003D13AD6F
MNNLFSKKGLRLVLLTGFSAALIGCSLESDELKDALTHDAKMSFVNALDYMADFHVKKRYISSSYSGLFDSKNISSKDVPKKATGSTYAYSYRAIHNMVNLGVKDSNSNSNKQKMYKSLSDGDNLWVIAWESAEQIELSVISKKKSNRTGAFNVRVFADGNYNIVVDGTQVATTEKAKVSGFITVDTCADGLTINGAAIDLCTGDPGQSYLLVVDKNGKRVMAKE